MSVSYNCPFCRRPVMLGASYCNFCGEALFEQAQSPASEWQVQPWTFPKPPLPYPMFPYLVRPFLPAMPWMPYVAYW